MCSLTQVTTTQASFLSRDDLERELSTARRETDRLLTAVRDFVTFAHAEPWAHLDDVLRELRASAVTVAALERLVAGTE